MKTIIPRPGAFRPSLKSPIRHPADTTIVVKVNGLKAIGPFPVAGVAHQLAKLETGLLSYRRPNAFTWI